MKRLSFLINPFAVFAWMWIIVIVLYQLKWSDLYPDLSTDLFVFLIFTIVISLFLGYFTWANNMFNFYLLDDRVTKYFPIIRKILKILFLLLAFDIVYCGYIPMITPIISPEKNYLNFGAPMIHVIVVIGFLLIFVCCFWFYRCSKKKKNKYSFIKLCLVCCAQPLICYSRAQLFYMFLAAFIVLISCSNNVKKVFFRIGILSVFLLYIFGLMGDSRHTSYNFSFANIVHANNNFYNIGISEAFLWPYVYISSPIANVQNMINTRGNTTIQEEGLDNFIYNNLIIGSIKKRLGLESSLVSVAGDKRHLITTDLNVGSCYYAAFGSFQWVGMFLVFFYYILITFITVKIIPNNSILKLPLIIILLFISISSIFSNPFNQEYYMLSLVILLVVSKLLQKTNIENYEKDRCIVSHI